MRYPKTKALFAGAALVMSLAACGDDSGGGSGGGDSVDIPVEENPDFPEGSTMAELSEAGKITIGVKIDQPGIGFQEPGADTPEGFDIEMGRIIAGQLGIEDDGSIEWKETISDNREPFLEEGEVDIVIASYSITDDRRKVVGQAGPYYVTGQQLLVREEDKDKITGPDDLAGVKVCSVEGSTSLATAQDEFGADPVPLGTYSECVDQLENSTVDVLTTDGAILLGYAAENPDELEVVGEPFSEERYGIGYQLGDTEMCEFITTTIQDAMDDGLWADAFEATLGESGVETPESPEMDECL
ncbi:MAG: glutamate ABC transporter substrate-binding protein [Propionibacteriales bacterium]|jgi:glutamate transport system substrate-binding protein|nr:glutamate ABC transporter substrate-binding protein [Propionibacteriales bacterium]